MLGWRKREILLAERNLYRKWILNVRMDKILKKEIT